MADHAEPKEIPTGGAAKAPLEVPADDRLPSAKGVRSASALAHRSAEDTVQHFFGSTVIDNKPSGDKTSDQRSGDKAACALVDDKPNKVGVETPGDKTGTPDKPIGKAVEQPKTPSPPTEAQIEKVFGKYAADGVLLQGDGLNSQYNWFRPNVVQTGRLASVAQGEYTPVHPDQANAHLCALDHVALPKGEVKNSAFVDQQNFATAPLDVGLHTADLETCGALVVVDRNRGQQYLAHIDTSVTPEQIKNSLKSFDLNDPNLKVYMLPGPTHSTVPTAIVEAFSGTKAGANMKIVDWNGEEGRRGIAVYNGEIMSGSNKIGQSFD